MVSMPTALRRRPLLVTLLLLIALPVIVYASLQVVQLVQRAAPTSIIQNEYFNQGSEPLTMTLPDGSACPLKPDDLQ